MGRQTKHHRIRVLTLTGTPFLAYYHISGDTVEILAVFHGARRRFTD